jgi:sirohydrochlorin ferrochelatase
MYARSFGRGKFFVITGLLLIAHGSRRSEANADLATTVEALVKRGYPIVEPAFLEFAAPDIDTSGDRCVARGAQRVVLMPYFLAAGVHVRSDLAEARARLAARFPDVSFQLAKPLGPHPLLDEIVAERLREVLQATQ